MSHWMNSLGWWFIPMTWHDHLIWHWTLSMFSGEARAPPWGKACRRENRSRSGARGVRTVWRLMAAHTFTIATVVACRWMFVGIEDVNNAISAWSCSLPGAGWGRGSTEMSPWSLWSQWSLVNWWPHSGAQRAVLCYQCPHTLRCREQEELCNV